MPISTVLTRGWEIQIRLSLPKDIWKVRRKDRIRRSKRRKRISLPQARVVGKGQALKSVSDQWVTISIYRLISLALHS